MSSEIDAESWAYQCLSQAKSSQMREICGLIDRVAAVDVTVLVQGESGTGKEVAAHALHIRSSRRDRPFIRVNCAAIPDDLVENELFGSEPGAFTGAVHEKPGKFEIAHNGTLFLDEIGDLAPRLQAKLLHALQDREVTRLGSVEPHQVDVRVIAATSRDLEAALQAGQFREDLYYRLNVVNITLPPLRERREDVLDLAHHFLRLHAQRYHRDVPELEGPVREFLLRHDWPGNVRELDNVMKRLVLIGESAVQDDFMPDRSPPDESLKDVSRSAAREVERVRILQALEDTHWNRRRAASTLQISYRSLLYKLKEICASPGDTSKVSTR